MKSNHRKTGTASHSKRAASRRAISLFLSLLVSVSGLLIILPL
jgi:hypothetical protein